MSNNNELFVGSICLTEILDKMKEGHSAFSKGSNGKIYFNCVTWLNAQEDKFGNIMSHQLSSTKENREREGVCYIGNSKVPKNQSQPVTKRDMPDVDTSHIQEREKTNPVDDLPF